MLISLLRWLILQPVVLSQDRFLSVERDERAKKVPGFQASKFVLSLIPPPCRSKSLPALPSLDRRLQLCQLPYPGLQ